MRGVHRNARKRLEDEGGSSPHARGPPIWKQRGTEHSRIIPACAGSTVVEALTWAVYRDHPRMRGVHSLVSRPSNTILGSSPHARGPLLIQTLTGVSFRIIPACAGSTYHLTDPEAHREDHPRMRGVH